MELNKEDKILIKNEIEKINKGGSTPFLDPRQLQLVTSVLNKNKTNYQIYKPSIDSEKNVIYTSCPNIIIYKITTNNNLRHQDILGSLFALNLNQNLFGDIIFNDNWYIVVKEHISYYLSQNLVKIGKYNVSLEQVEIDTLNNVAQKYVTEQIIVPSFRIDAVLPKIIKTNRSKILELINDKDIILNYKILTNNSYILKENDIFGIRKYGKYKFIGIEKQTKKDNYIINIGKYV